MYNVHVHDHSLQARPCFCLVVPVHQWNGCTCVNGNTLLLPETTERHVCHANSLFTHERSNNTSDSRQNMRSYILVRAPETAGRAVGTLGGSFGATAGFEKLGITPSHAGGPRVDSPLHGPTLTLEVFWSQAALAFDKLGSLDRVPLGDSLVTSFRPAATCGDIITPSHAGDRLVDSPLHGTTLDLEFFLRQVTYTTATRTRTTRTATKQAITSQSPASTESASPPLSASAPLAWKRTKRHSQSKKDLGAGMKEACNRTPMPRSLCDWGTVTFVWLRT